MAKTKTRRTAKTRTKIKAGGKAKRAKAKVARGQRAGKAKPIGKLAGKNVALVGKFGYADYYRSRYQQLVDAAGGALIHPNKNKPDYLFVGEGRGGKPPGDVAKLQKKYPAVQVLDQAAIAKFLLPSREEVLYRLAHREERDDRFWEELDKLGSEAGAVVDLRGADLRKATASGAYFNAVDLNGVDFRGADVTYAQLPDQLEKANFDGCDGKHTYVKNLMNCNFRNADLEEVWMFFHDGNNIQGCDFSGSKMKKARLERGVAADCCFKGCSLEDAELEESTFDRCDFSQIDGSRLHGNQAKFTEVIFQKANLTRADLRNASLAGADLRGANLREAVLSGADLSGAQVAGADFQDAVLTGAKLTGVDFSKAKNYQPPVVRKAGPKLLELVAASKGSAYFSTEAEVELGKGEYASLGISVSNKHCYAQSVYKRQGNQVHDRITATTLTQALLALRDRWPKGKLKLDSISAKGSKTLRGQKLKDLAIAAWAEAFGITFQSAEELQADSAAHQAETVRERDELMKRVRSQGATVWNDLEYQMQGRLDLRGADLSKSKLDEIRLLSCDLKGANFAKSSLKNAELWSSQFVGASLTGANLSSAGLQGCNLTGANLVSANLTEADLSNVKLQGADLTGAVLTGATLTKAQYDEKTRFPAGFRRPTDMLWKGNGLAPGASKKKVKAAPAGSLDFDSFLKRLAKKIDAGRLGKARLMLKADRFQLFADVKDDSLVGVVKSQTDKDLVYSCRLASEGAFSCCTQNLRPCGGLQGTLCKHLLVLIVGLAKAGKLDCATVVHWMELSNRQKPALDTEEMSATLLRYKGAEAGEVDWRPTETIPEDFYAM